jgi:hypothetical protein
LNGVMVIVFTYFHNIMVIVFKRFHGVMAIVFTSLYCCKWCYNTKIKIKSMV